MPFDGDISGCAWNGRAFFRKHGTLLARKGRMMRNLLSSYDFLCISDTHSSDEAVLAFRTDPCNQDLISFWSHESPQRGGVGIVLRPSFAAKFHKINATDWQEMIPGRLARLRLRHNLGRLDIFVAYLCPRSRENRLHAIQRIADTPDD